MRGSKDVSKIPMNPLSAKYPCRINHRPYETNTVSRNRILGNKKEMVVGLD